MNHIARFASHLLPHTLCLLCAFAFSVDAARAQDTTPVTPGVNAPARLRLDSLDALAAKATGETVDISLDGATLRLATQVAGSNDILKNLPPGIDQATVRELLANLQAVHVKVYNFKEPGAYTAANLEPVFSQLRGSGSGWSSLIAVNESGANGEKVNVFAANDPARNDRINGVAVVVQQPKELVVGYVIGSIDTDTVLKMIQLF